MNRILNKSEWYCFQESIVTSNDVGDLPLYPVATDPQFTGRKILQMQQKQIKFWMYLNVIATFTLMNICRLSKLLYKCCLKIAEIGMIIL